MSVIHQPRKPDLDARVLLFPAVLFLLLCLMFIRLWYLQVVQAGSLVERAAAISATNIPELAPRGLIFDRNEVMLAGVKPEWVVTAIPRVVNKNPGVIDKVAQMLAADPKKLKAKLKEGSWRPSLPTPIFIGASTQTASALAERSDEFPGIDVRSQPMRYYPDSKSFSHLMGHVWVPSKGDVDRIKAFGKDPADYVGKGGIEASYEKNLMGTAGEIRMEMDAMRRPTKVIGRDPSIPGEQLILSIDKNLQQTAIAALTEKNYRGAVVAIDPATGEILCMASTPTFDQNLFKNGISHTDFDRLNNDPGHPFLNRPMQVKFAPGSTFKIVTTIAAMEQGVFDPNRPEICRGGIQLGNKFIKCLGHHGAVTFSMAFTKSCNAYFMSLALKAKKAGMLKAAQGVGIYQRSGLDLPAEARGSLPTERFMAKYYPKYHWPLADTAYLGIGQGILAVTPVQMANVAALVANDGVNYKPHVVRAIRNAMDHEKLQWVKAEELHRIDGSAQFWATLRAAMVNVIENGTARSGASIPGIVWGGKTGSAEQKKEKKTHAWFVGFAPADHPKIAICAFVEEAGHGGDVAAPIARKVVERYLLPPKDPKAASKRPTAPSASVDMVELPVNR